METGSVTASQKRRSVNERERCSRSPVDIVEAAHTSRQVPRRSGIAGERTEQLKLVSDLAVVWDLNAQHSSCIGSWSGKDNSDRRRTVRDTQCRPHWGLF